MVKIAEVPQYPKGVDPSDFGDFATEDDDVDFDDDEVEPWERYKSNSTRVFYPIRVGEVVNQRYSIEHKIGHGGFSTVWMAHDLQTKRDVALKIMTSEAGEVHEYRMQQEITTRVRDTSRLVMYKDTFLLRGNQCNHWVLVLPLRGQPLVSLGVAKRPLATRMSAARQLLEILKNLHGAGIIHHDLNGKNCLWGISRLDNLSRDAKYKIFGRPIKEDLSYIEGLWKPGEVVMPLTIPDNMCTDTLYLGDFGLSMRVGSEVFPPGRPPLEYCSPERLHSQVPSTACDMWSYMCLFAQLYTGRIVFSPYANEGVVESMVKRLGPMPQRWKNCLVDKSFDSWYDPKTKPLPEFTLEKYIVKILPDIDPVEKGHVLSLLTRGFSYEPEKRLTAAQLLQDPSFKALMAKYCP